MKKNNIRLFVLSIVAIMGIVAFALYAAPFVSLKLGSVSDDITGFQLAFDEDRQYITEDGSSFVFLISLALTFCGCIAGIVALVVTLLSQAGKINPKQMLDPQKRKITYGMSIVGTVILGIIPLIINLLSVRLAGYSDNPLAHLGSGAVASSILHLLGLLLFAGTNVFLPAIHEDVQVAQKE